MRCAVHRLVPTPLKRFLLEEQGIYLPEYRQFGSWICWCISIGRDRQFKRVELTHSPVFNLLTTGQYLSGSSDLIDMNGNNLRTCNWYHLNEPIYLCNSPQHPSCVHDRLGKQIKAARCGANTVLCISATKFQCRQLRAVSSLPYQMWPHFWYKL